ncbi:Protein FAR1-RELATED SEQUENCE 11 [Bienertia sinuspersici]
MLDMVSYLLLKEMFVIFLLDLREFLEKMMLKAIYRTIIPEEFECKWDTMVHKYNLQENTHIHGLYNVKCFWASAYLRDNFFGGMITTGRSESINAFIKKFVSSNVSLTDFVKQVDIVVQEIAQGRLYNNLTTDLRPIPVKSKSPLEEQAFGVLTPFASKKFQDEFFRASQYSITHDQGNKFTVRYFQGETPTNHNVFWDGVTETCSCKNFEFWGILCRHIFRVFIHKDCFKIPLFYLPLRWYRDALQTTTISQGGALNSSSSVVQGLTCSVGEGEDIMTEEELMDDEPTDVTTVYLPPKSKTKGRPKKRREKGPKELGKKTKSCSICKQPGHTKPTCPHKDNILGVDEMEDGAPSASQKKLKKTAHDLGINLVFTLIF